MWLSNLTRRRVFKISPYRKVCGATAFSAAASVVASQPTAERSPPATRNLSAFGEGKEEVIIGKDILFSNNALGFPEGGEAVTRQHDKR